MSTQGLDPETGRKLIEALHKAIREAERLRRDIHALHARIEPFDDEKTVLHPSIAKFETPKTLNDALKLVVEVHKYMYNCELDLNAIRSVMTEISDDVVSRDDLKPYLKKTRDR